MQLERIEIAGFRGIQRLSLSLERLTTLIGENTWGKSSLLDALEIALPNHQELYQFKLQDFHLDYVLSQPQTQSIQIITRWRTQTKGEENIGRYRKLRPVWLDVSGSDDKELIYQVSATRDQHNKITTHYQFLNQAGDILQLHQSEKLALELASLHPVLRMRDARRLHLDGQADEEIPEAVYREVDTRRAQSRNQSEYEAKIQKRIQNTYRRLNAAPGHVNKGEIKSSLRAMQHLIEHYFSYKPQKRHGKHNRRDGLFQSNLNDQHTLLTMIKESKNTQSKLMLMGLMQAYIQAKGSTPLRKVSRPILILEDPEGRLHPTNLLKSWELLQLIPMQKILTTNSGVLLSAVPLSSIRRLVRQSDRTQALPIPKNLLSKDEIRRVSFHIRFHRSNAFFARCWLLVEGETEVWLFNELARICGYNLAAEGVQIIEFAQSGLKSLIKVAKALHIDWHVVSDGDPAGKKYSHTVRSLLGTDQERHRLTELPDRDIEHFLYNNGFEAFYRDLVKIPMDHPIPAKKILARVLKKHAKPDVALGIVKHCEEQGIESIPILIRWILKRVLTMANGNT